MKTASIASLLASAFFAQQAVATSGWGDAPSFSNPSNTNNECTPQQQPGFNWQDIPSGSNVGNYGGMDFSGFACKDSFAPSKRWLRTRSDFQVRNELVFHMIIKLMETVQVY